MQVDSQPGSLDVGVNWDDVDGADDYLVRWRSVDNGGDLNAGVRAQSSDTNITVADYGEWVVQVEACNNAGCGKPVAQEFKVEPAPTPDSEPVAEAASKSTSETASEHTVQAELPPYFPTVPSEYFFTKGQDIGTQTLPEAAGGAGGFTYSLSPSPPEGLSFDPASRALTGTPTEAGQHSMTYTATDAEGTQAVLSFQIAIYATALQVNGDATPEKPGTPTVTRTTFSEPSDPALDVTWTAPAGGVTPTGYEAQYRKKAADGADPAEWTAYSGTLGATATTLNLPDLDAGATYEVQVRAVSDGESGPWSDIGEGRANRPPRSTEPANVQPINTLLWGGDDSVRTLSDKFADDDGDSLTYSASAQHPGVLKVGIEGDDSDKLRIHVLNPATSTVTYGASDGYGGYASKTIDVSGSADAFNGADLSRSVAENSAAGTAVGDAVTGNPYNGAALTYSLTGEASTSGDFVIDSASGQISVKQGASLDYETKSSYTGKVKWTVQGQQASADVTIEVTDVGPGQPAAPTVTRTRFSEPTNPALDVTWTAPDAKGTTITGYEARYREQGATDWTDYGGALGATATTFNLPDLNAGATYEFQVRAVSSGESGPWSDTGSGRANRPPRSTEPANVQPINTLLWGGDDSVRTLSDKFADDDGDSLTYSASAQHPGVLKVGIEGDDSDKLRIHVLNPATSTVTYGASDGYGGYASKTIDVSGSADAFNGAGLSRSVAENSPAGTAVGNPVTGNPYNGGALSYSLTGEAAGAFVIDASSGQISVKQGAGLDFETKSSYTGKVHWTVQGQQAFADVTIEVTDIGAAKPDAPAVTRTPFEGESPPALDVTWTAPAVTGVTITGYEARYRKQDDTAWTDHGAALSAQTTSLNLPDLQPGAIYEVQVRALTNIEGPGPWSDIGSGRANRPPKGNNRYLNSRTRDINTIRHWSGAWSPLTTFSDEDGDQLHRLTSVSQYPGMVRTWISGGGQQLNVHALNPGKSIITYSVDDGHGGVASKTVTHTGSQNETRSIVENSAAGTHVGDPVTGRPYDDGDDQTDDALSYTLTGEAADAFVIDASTGQISVKQGASIDYETKTSYTGQVHWTIQGQPAVADLTIEVIDIPVPAQPAAPSLARTPFEGESPPALDVTWTAPSDNGSGLTGYEVRYRKQDDTAWTDHGAVFSAQTTSLNVPNLQPGVVYEVQVRAIGDDGAGEWSASGSARANRPPKGTSRFLNSRTRDVGWLRYWTGVWSPLNGFSDEDGDQIQRLTSVSQYPGIVETWISNGGRDLNVRALNPGKSVITYSVDDGYGGVASKTVTHTGRQEETRHIAENSVAGTHVGAPVTGKPHDDGDDQTDDALTYTLTGDAADAFVIDSSTGQISVKQGATIDFEAKSSYAGQVHWTIQGQPAVADLSIEVTDLRPDGPNPPAVEWAATDPNTRLSASWNTPNDNGETIIGYHVQYRLHGSQNDADWVTRSWDHPDTNITISGLQPATTYEVRVQAQAEGTDGWFSGPGAGTTNRPPVLDETLTNGKVTRQVAENSPAGTQVGGPVSFTDPEGHVVSYALTDDSNSFVIDSATGQIGVAPGAALDHETVAEIEVTVVATDPQAGQASTTVTIAVTDLEAGQPGTPTVTRTQFSEPTNPALDVSWSAADANGTTITGYEAQYRKQGADEWTDYAGALGPTASSLNLPDLEAGAIYEVQVRALTQNEGPGPWSIIGSGRANRPPARTTPGFLLPSFSLPWGGPDTLQLVSGQISDPDGDSLTFSASAAHPGVFRVGIEGQNSDMLRVHVLNPASSLITFTASDAYGGFVSESVNPTGLRNETRHIAENSAAGTAAGDPVTGTPYDDGDDQTDDALTYTL
ncbi:MAG: fibronectin type III domain-containing protein, partial [Chloroflexi bacterium]|nr:fibronectin type III domain-containing protein [Chloroflexota bacterium]